ncbi:MAG: hypothetical protein VKJ06_00040 [Vampirovibrionales bacterium]|nr:hypothetical protein [Vampirovibrionales bacterium]
MSTISGWDPTALNALRVAAQTKRDVSAMMANRPQGSSSSSSSSFNGGYPNSGAASAYEFQAFQQAQQAQASQMFMMNFMFAVIQQLSDALKQALSMIGSGKTTAGKTAAETPEKTDYAGQSSAQSLTSMGQADAQTGTATSDADTAAPAEANAQTDASAAPEETSKPFELVA